MNVRPGTWEWGKRRIDGYDQYQHLSVLDSVARENRSIRTTLGQDYLVTPDVVVSRAPVNNFDSNESGWEFLSPLLSGAPYAGKPILHGVISCKFTMRSDRAQNSRTEALNLIRNRKGKLPSIAVVTMEPYPNRLASIALGTGDIDCTYHAALHELRDALEKDLDFEEGRNLLETMIEGRRLRDIADLPLDLAL